MNDTAPSGYYRVSKKDARKYFKAGYEVYVLPCKVRFDLKSSFIQPIKISKETHAQTFDYIINAYSAYNCNNELGTYVSYYLVS